MFTHLNVINPIYTQTQKYEKLFTVQNMFIVISVLPYDLPNMNACVCLMTL